MEDQIRNTVAPLDLFAALSDNDREQLIAASSLMTFAQGDVIIAEGTSVENLFVVRSGDVHVSTHSLGRDVDLKTLSTSAYFGEVSVLSGKSATATVSAKTAVELVAIPKPEILNLVERDEAFRKTLEGVTLARAKDTLGKVLK